MQQELPAPGAASREKISPTRLHSPMQRRYATEAAHGARGEQGKNSSLLDCFGWTNFPWVVRLRPVTFQIILDIICGQVVFFR